MEIYDLKGSLILRIVLAVPLAILILKAGWYFLKDIQNNNEERVDFEELVRRKTELLKYSGQEINSLPKEIKHSNTEKVYREFYELPQNHNNADKRRILQIFSSLQWGEGPLHFEIINNLKKFYEIEIDLVHVGKSLKDLINMDILISSKWKNLPNYLELEQILSMKAILDVFGEEAKKLNGKNLRKFCEKEKLDLIQTSKAFIFIFFPNLRNMIFSNLTHNNPSDHFLFSSFSSKDLSEKINQSLSLHKGPQIFFKDLANLSILFGSLKKIEPLRSKFDLDGAHRIFNLERNSSMEDIRKRYKTLAKINHPDSLSSLGLTPEILDLVNGNFAQIKNAYDLLVANELAK